MKIKEPIIYPAPWTTLYKEQVDVIIDVVLDVLKHDGKVPKTGTFMLYGKSDDKPDIQEILKFNFKNGAIHDCCGSHLTSEELGATILRRAAIAEYSTNATIDYYADSPTFLRLKSTYGAFLCFFYGGEDFDNAYVYCAVAMALSKMCEQDIDLKDACGDLFLTEMEDHTGLSALAGFIDGVFAKCELPALKVWEKWNKTADKTILYFQ